MKNIFKIGTTRLLKANWYMYIQWLWNGITWIITSYVYTYMTGICKHIYSKRFFEWQFGFYVLCWLFPSNSINNDSLFNKIKISAWSTKNVHSLKDVHIMTLTLIINLYETNVLQVSICYLVFHLSRHLSDSFLNYPY